jgi:hypothetical protein
MAVFMCTFRLERPISPQQMNRKQERQRGRSLRLETQRGSECQYSAGSGIVVALSILLGE